MPNYKTTNPGRKPVYKTQPTKIIEQFNSYDASEIANIIGTAIGMADGLTKEEQTEINDAFQQLYVSFGMSQAAMSFGLTNTSMSNPVKSIRPLGNDIAGDVERAREAANRLSDALYRTLDSQADDEKNPFIAFYADYFRGISHNLSYFKTVGSDALMDNVMGVISSNCGFEDPINNKGISYEEFTKETSDVPLFKMVSDAVAMHRIIADESDEGDSHPERELQDKAAMIKLCKDFKAKYQEFGNYDNEKFEVFRQKDIFQNSKEQILTRGLGQAIREANERQTALEHGWLVRDLPLISRCGYMVDKVTTALSEEGNKYTEVQKAQMQGFIDFYKDDFLKNSAPMTEQRRNELISTLKQKFTAIDTPEMAAAKKYALEGNAIEDDSKDVGNRVDAARNLALINQIDATQNRKLTSYEKASMGVSLDDFNAIVDRFDDKFANMPKKPMFARTTGEFGHMQLAYDQLKNAIKMSADPANDEDVYACAKKLYKATQDYMYAKDKQKKLNPDNMSLADRRLNNPNRSEYGQYRYDLSDELGVSAKMIMKLHKDNKLKKDLEKVETPSVKGITFVNLKDKLGINNSINDNDNGDINHYDEIIAENKKNKFKAKKKEILLPQK